MRKSRFSEVLKEAQAGLPVAEVCRKHGISDGARYCRAAYRLRNHPEYRHNGDLGFRPARGQG